MPIVRMQRVEARGEIGVRRAGEATRLARLYQDGAAKVRFPASRGGPLEAVLINTAGGMTGGDRLCWKAEAGQGAHLTLTTQACEKIYRAESGIAKTEIALEAGPGARLAWLPQESILFDRAAFERTLSVDLAADTDCLLVESLLLGRKAMGETVRQALFRDRWRVRVDGRLVHAEDFRFDGDAAALFARTATGSGAAAMATILMIGQRGESLAGELRDLLAARAATVKDAGGQADFAVSAWKVGASGKLLARVMASDGYHFRSLLQPALGLLNGKAGLPKIWSN